MHERAVCTGRSIGDPSASPWRDDLRRGLEFAALDAGGEQPTVGDLPGAMDHGIVGQDHPQRAEERLREVETSQTEGVLDLLDRKSTRLNSSHRCISYAVFCLKKKTASD